MYQNSLFGNLNFQGQMKVKTSNLIIAQQSYENDSCLRTMLILKFFLHFALFSLFPFPVSFLLVNQATRSIVPTISLCVDSLVKMKYRIWNCPLIFCIHTKAQIIAKMMIPVVVPPIALNKGEPILNVSCPEIRQFSRISVNSKLTLRKKHLENFSVMWLHPSRYSGWK